LQCDRAQPGPRPDPARSRSLARRIRSGAALAGLLVLSGSLLAQADSPARGFQVGHGPDEGRSSGAVLRVLFVGNSLTAAHDLPELVRTMAAGAGVTMEVAARAPGGFSLADHWGDRSLRKLLAEGRFDFLVLQQGPSSQPESRRELLASAVRWAKEARRRGARPALYMVWPFRDQPRGFTLVSTSYREAAKGADALVLPAGEAWREALAADPRLHLYQEDGLHPTPAGSYLAALVVAHGLAGVDPESVPARLELPSGRRLELGADLAAALRRAARRALAGAEPTPPSDR
jgi:hypothetical protein